MYGLCEDEMRVGGDAGEIVSLQIQRPQLAQPRKGFKGQSGQGIVLEVEEPSAHFSHSSFPADGRRMGPEGFGQSIGVYVRDPIVAQRENLEA